MVDTANETGNADVKPMTVLSALRHIWSALKEENAAFYLATLYLIFEYNRPQLVYPALDVIPWGKTLLLLGLSASLIDNDSKLPRLAVLLPVIAFSALVVLSTIFAFSPAAAVADWTMFFGWVLVYLLLTSVVTTRRRLFLFICIYFLSNLKMAQHGFRSWAGNGFGFSGWGVTGSPGWFQNSGEFGLEMVVFLPFLFAYLVHCRRSWSRNLRGFFYFCIVMVIGSIIASSSRGAVLGLVVVGVWLMWQSQHRLKTVFIVAILASIIYQVMPSEFKGRFATAGEDNTSLARLVYWRYGIEAVKDHPMTGIGYRNWTLWLPSHHPEVASFERSKNVEVIHNTYLEAATELGLPGIVLYLTTILSMFAINYNTAAMARRTGDSFMLATAVGLNGSLLGYLVPSYFMAVLYYPYIWILLAITHCLSSVCRREFSQNSETLTDFQGVAVAHKT
ncbi:O-antigen ligase family protein [Geomonas azotofigens]|uniref:O-antigen ligase family protein n=1 Tax=Geomonas azotofigens TaxID=2843196 RepID=UPI001C11211A|nr:O-antigen ligase family protein [Geomonas azotofigens]MBU5613501.1 O-antigen ligase family protein [Geomonas azotofigens]